MKHAFLLACLASPAVSAPAAPTQADLDALAKSYKEAFTKQDKAALKTLYFVEGKHGEMAFEEEMRFLSVVMASEVTDVGIAKGASFSLGKRAALAPNLEPVADLHIGFKAAKGGTDSVLIPVGIKDGAYRVALYVPLAVSAFAAALASDAAPADPSLAAPLPSKGSLADVCRNEIGMFCKDRAAKAKELAACLEQNSSGLTKPCRKALRAR